MRGNSDWAKGERDGQEVVAANRLDDETLEVQFRDGEWMLCALDELEQTSVDAQLRDYYREEFHEHRADTRTLQEQYEQDRDIPMSQLNSNHPLRIASFGASGVQAQREIFDHRQRELEPETGVATCMDCGDSMEGYEGVDYPPDYCDACEGDHEDEY